MLFWASWCETFSVRSNLYDYKTKSASHWWKKSSAGQYNLSRSQITVGDQNPAQVARHWVGTLIVCRSAVAAISVKVRNYVLAVMAVETSDSVSLHFEKIIRQGLERLSEFNYLSYPSQKRKARKFNHRFHYKGSKFSSVFSVIKAMNMCLANSWTRKA